MHESIREGFDVFLHDGDDSVGAVRRVHKHGIMVYVEDAGDYEVPVSAIVDVDAEPEGATIYIACPEDRRGSAKLRALTAWLRDVFGDPPYWERVPHPR